MRRFKFGYEFKKMQIIIIEEEAEIIKQIFTSYQEGLSTSKIAKKLNQQDIRYKDDTSEWNRGNVSCILKDKTYLGDDDYPQIIDRETFDKVHKLMARKAHKIPEKEQAYANVFKEKTRCAICGDVITRRSLVKGNLDKVQMKCTNIECECSKISISLPDIEKYIKKIFEMIEDNNEIIEGITCETENLDNNSNVSEMTDVLRIKMRNPSINTDEIINEIINIGNVRFEACKASADEKITESLKEQISKTRRDSRIGADDIDKTIKRIILAPDKTVTIKFKNGKEFSERIV